MTLIIQLANLNHSTIDFALLPKQIVDEADKFNDERKKQFLVCRSILANLLKQYCDISILPTIVVGDNGRPCFLERHLPDFNISHSQNWVAVAISLTGMIGLDVEVDRPRKNYLKVAKNFFADDEYQWLIKQDDSLRAFWQLWTLKESALKLYAKGVWQIKSVNVDLTEQVITAPFAQHFYYQYHQVDDVHLSVNCNEPISELILLS
ncbi:4'-phosphopantetheinyl transferase superfamily protein [Gilliamella sp. Pra-s65]|uniref:4'-phosphopantetheinyl transferase family protein n=1 Tax=unclassified Gilliamella TaxID=2685620 RepID=UPI00132619D8|nr:MULTISPECIES: 4'-phosphopantetheinyl transferase superfamily protein [unclassified Gilliamella]MWN32733.1 4'-phosphopantetheinyl transferase superfamily protein [Gilliamella sp. Pra-s60]MWN90852.1 4'-phosphopantetheinyl transferase superfamily protein [Gilliamella sp. Pra-s65]MWP30137.1 4'-phosphopantetheinyl transferase superfamily protein [Gilliamella sp. Pra-s54]MWP47352.1 4'-phosphopantetheinyl transferase superfamily protein [Gilliamella sp. Pas-s27]MWP73791.1 4'-phosphopantetheinyl tr